MVDNLIEFDAMISKVRQALQAIDHPRFFETERGYQGQFNVQLAGLLHGAELEGAIVEEEYQKNMKRHGIRRRPDLIVHVPTAQADRSQGNFTVIQFKRKASARKAKADFEALDEIFDKLKYPFGAFVNIGSSEAFGAAYQGPHQPRIHFFATWQEGNMTKVVHEYFDEAGNLKRS